MVEMRANCAHILCAALRARLAALASLPVLWQPRISTARLHASPESGDRPQTLRHGLAPTLSPRLRCPKVAG